MPDVRVAKPHRSQPLRRRAESDRAQGDGYTAGPPLPDGQGIPGSDPRLSIALREPGAHGQREPEPAKSSRGERVSAPCTRAVWLSAVARAVGQEASGPLASDRNAARIRNVR